MKRRVLTVNMSIRMNINIRLVSILLSCACLSISFFSHPEGPVLKCFLVAQREEGTSRWEPVVSLTVLNL